MMKKPSTNPEAEISVGSQTGPKNRIIFGPFGPNNGEVNEPVFLFGQLCFGGPQNSIAISYEIPGFLG